MQDLAMRPAHGAEAVAVGQESGETRIDAGSRRRARARRCVAPRCRLASAISATAAARLGVVERVGDLAQPVERRVEPLVLLAQRARRRRRHGGAAEGAAPGPSARSALRITATSIASCVSAPATGVSQPNAAAPIATPDSAMPATMLCRAMRAGAPGDDDRIGDPVEPIHQNDDVGGLRRGAGAARAHGDADIGGGQAPAHR